MYMGVFIKKINTKDQRFSSRLQISKESTRISIIAILINPTSILVFIFEEKAPITEIKIGKSIKTN